jgi:hypothetical protein
MMNNQKSTKEAPPKPARDTSPAWETAPFTAFATLFQKGVEGLAELQKNKLDLIANQSSDAIAAWKKAFAVPSSAPGAYMLDLADQGIGKMAEAQKDMIDLMVQQNARMVDMSNERPESASKWAAGLADVVGEAADTTVAAHKICLNFVAEQNKAVAEAVKRQVGVAGSAPAVEAVDTMQRNVDIAIQAQKELMEAAAKPAKAGAKQAA